MKCVSFNINSLRTRLHQLEAVVERHSPDVIGLQETKVQDSEYPLAAIEALGYHSIHTGQKTHYGVALLSRTPLINPITALPQARPDDQPRLVAGTWISPSGTQVHILNGYFPQGENREHPIKFPNKARFYHELREYLHSHYQPDDALILMGDMNVAPEDIDIGIGEDARKRWLRQGTCCFLPEEREWLAALTEWGLFDTFRARESASGHYSWFDYRSRGFERDPRRGLRIDLILASRALAPHLSGAGIDLETRAMPRPSDHCPVWAEFTGI